MKKLASRKDSRIVDLLIAFGPLGYGIYALLVDYLKERKAFRSIDDVKRIAYELHTDAETVRSVIEDFGLFTVDDEGIITHKGIERKAPAAKEPAKSEISENSESSELPELTVAAASEPEVSSPVPVPVTSSSQKRRERRKRLRFHSVLPG